MNDIPRPAPMAEKIYAFPVEFRHVAGWFSAALAI